MFKQESMITMPTLCIGPSSGLRRKVKILRADWFSTLCLSNANPKISNLLAQWNTLNLDVLRAAGGLPDLCYSVK